MTVTLFAWRRPSLKLYCLVQHANEPENFGVLLKEVWGYDANDDVRMVRVHVGGLRQKIEADVKVPKLIQITNVGYRLNVDEA